MRLYAVFLPLASLFPNYVTPEPKKESIKMKCSQRVAQVNPKYEFNIRVELVAMYEHFDSSLIMPKKIKLS